ncbi:MAG TPA: cell division protein ZapA [Caulobacteraceae bacterium]|nr:cell division protein ZapA [Caulobacteraceae bacterium]
MAQVTIQINAKPYLVGCEDGQEQRLIELAETVDRQVRQVHSEVGALGETRLLLMGALLLADELGELKARLSAEASSAASLQRSMVEIEGRAADALNRAAERIENLAGEAPPAGLR